MSHLPLLVLITIFFDTGQEGARCKESIECIGHQMIALESSAFTTYRHLRLGRSCLRSSTLPFPILFKADLSLQLCSRFVVFTVFLHHHLYRHCSVINSSKRNLCTLSGASHALMQAGEQLSKHDDIDRTARNMNKPGKHLPQVNHWKRHRFKGKLKSDKIRTDKLCIDR